jgi:hypothetical protein
VTNKALHDINQLLKMRTRRNKQVKHETGTIDKANLMLLTSIAADCGLDDAASFITAVQSLLHEILCFISQSNDVAGTVNELKSVFNPDNPDKPLIMNRTTVSNMIPDPDIKQLDKALEEQAAECLDDLAEAGIKHEEVIIASDGTGTPAKTSHRNGDMQYLYIGQKNTFKQGYYYETQYNISDKLFIGLNYHDNWHRGRGGGMFEPWLQEIIDKCTATNKAGTTPAFVEGDRFYFKVGLFASTTLGFLDPCGVPGQGPRVITPVKFSGEKTTFKWNYLLDNTRDEVFTRYFKLKVADNPLLAARWADLFNLPGKKEQKVFYACVALVDEYGKDKKRTLAQLRAQATRVQELLDKIKKEEAATVQEYIDYTGVVNAEKKKSPIGARGKKREKFADDKEKRLYHTCLDLAAKKASLKEEKKELIKSLTFFAISLHPGEDPSTAPSTFLELAHEYHERWGVENGIRDVKWRFLYRSRARGPVRRTFYMVLAMMLYNRWQVERAMVASSNFMNEAGCPGPPGDPHPWSPRRHSAGARDFPTAVTYLIECWRLAFMSVLEGILSHGN